VAPARVGRGPDLETPPEPGGCGLSVPTHMISASLRMSPAASYVRRPRIRGVRATSPEWPVEAPTRPRYPVAALPMTLRVTLLGPGDEARFSSVLPGVFDGPTRPELVAEFLADPRHHMAVALDDERIVGFASAVHYIHPDKGPELWINEVGVAPSHRRRGLARRLLRALFRKARALGCSGAWVVTDRENEAARALYEKTGVKAGIEQPVLYAFRFGEAPDPESPPEQ